MHLRPYQIPIFNDNTTGILGLHWARQLGKSAVLAAWAVDRLLTRPGRLVTVLSNCQQNGAEFGDSLHREVVGLVVRLREQKISMERLRLEPARFELDVADLVMKHIDKLKASGALQIEDRSEAAKKIREELFGKYTKEQLHATALSTV